MPVIEGITENSILITNDEGMDDAEEWHLVDFGLDVEYWTLFSIFRRFRDGMGYAYGGGWAEQLAIHIETIELFQALDALVKKDDDGNS